MFGVKINLCQRGYNKRLLYNLFFQPRSPPFIRAAGISFPVIMCHLAHSFCEVGFQMWDRISSPCLSLVSHTLCRRSELTSGNSRYPSGHHKCCVGGEKRLVSLFYLLNLCWLELGTCKQEELVSVVGRRGPKQGKGRSSDNRVTQARGSVTEPG